MNLKENIRDSWLVNQFIAHRGFYDENNPENTLGAFEQAIKNNFAIELDVRMLADETLVVFHDDSTSRLTEKDCYLSKLNYDELKQLKIKHTKFGIPTFKEALDFINGQVPVLIEIKNFSVKKIGKMEQKICDVLKDYKGEYAICSGNPYVVLWFKNNKPKIIRGIISSFYRNDDEGRQNTNSFFVRFVLKRMLMNKKIKPDFISYHCDNLPNKYVKKYKDLPILSWPVRSQEKYLEIIKYTDNIIFEHFKPKI